MCCILCHNNPVNATNPRTQVRRRLILYFKRNGMTSLKEPMDVDHGLVATIFEKQVNNLLKGKEGKKKSSHQKRLNLFENYISNFFAMKDPFKNDHVQQKQI
jgi:hypothetical protein